MRKNLLVLILLMSASISNAAEVTYYTVSASGIFHSVTATLSDLNKEARIRCVIYRDGKPVAKKDEDINGVGTLEIYIPGGIRDTQASCSELK